MQLILQRYHPEVDRREQSIRIQMPPKRGGGPSVAIKEAIDLCQQQKELDPGFYHRADISNGADADCTVNQFTWATGIGRQMAADYGDVLIMDCTYNVTR